MVQKLPPPPQFAGPEWQAFNRWLIELTSVLADNGGVNPNVIDGYPALVTQVGENASDITSLTNSMALVFAQVSALTNSLALANSSITTLSARAQVFQGSGAPAPALGTTNDWYANVGGAAGSRIYIKTAPATWTAFPF